MSTIVGDSIFGVAPLKRCFRIVNGGTPPPDDRYWGGDVPWVTPADLSSLDGGLVSTSARSLTNAGLTAGSALVPGGSLIVSTRAPIGYVVEATVPVSMNQGCRGLVPMPDVSAPYFKYVLLAGRSDLCARGNGTTFTELSSRGLGSAPVPVPPLDEQRRIVEYLDTETARIDDLIAEQERVQQPLQVEWLKSELVHALLPERSPLGWSRTRLKYLFQSERNGIWGDEPQDGPDDVVCVRVADFDRTNFKAGASAATVRCVPAPKRLPRLLVPGDVLLEKSGGTPDRPVGCAVTYDGDGPAVCSNFVAALRPAPEVDARFAALLLAACYEARRNAPFVKQTTGIQNLDSGAYLGSACALPARSEQERVARHLDRMIDLVQRRQSELKRQVELLHEHRQALITAAVTGGLEAVGRVA